jgi:hypothetical protein
LELPPHSLPFDAYYHFDSERYDLIGQISQQDPYSFKDFEVIRLDDLPHPEINYDITT